MMVHRKTKRLYLVTRCARDPFACHCVLRSTNTSVEHKAEVQVCVCRFFRCHCSPRAAVLFFIPLMRTGGGGCLLLLPRARTCKTHTHTKTEISAVGSASGWTDDLDCKARRRLNFRFFLSRQGINQVIIVRFFRAACAVNMKTCTTGRIGRSQCPKTASTKVLHRKPINSMETLCSTQNSGSCSREHRQRHDVYCCFFLRLLGNTPRVSLTCPCC